MHYQLQSATAEPVVLACACRSDAAHRLLMGPPQLSHGGN
ncbi:hypothetical protein APV28_3500 [Comamonas testosteroni]|nr:hypothetical protein APV28_3500 [Comamonas testosteroni]